MMIQTLAQGKEISEEKEEMMLFMEVMGTMKQKGMDLGQKEIINQEKILFLEEMVKIGSSEVNTQINYMVEILMTKYMGIIIILIYTEMTILMEEVEMIS